MSVVTAGAFDVAPETHRPRVIRGCDARVVLPARPRFAEQVQTYVELGALWGGGPVPAPGDDARAPDPPRSVWIERDGRD